MERGDVGIVLWGLQLGRGLRDGGLLSFGGERLVDDESNGEGTTRYALQAGAERLLIASLDPALDEEAWDGEQKGLAVEAQWRGAIEPGGEVAFRQLTAQLCGGDLPELGGRGELVALGFGFAGGL
jgi:hypothetical protein